MFAVEDQNEFPGRYSCGGVVEDKAETENILFCSGKLINGVPFKSKKTQR